jgi:predicted dinucleotide-binding enzyme
MSSACHSSISARRGPGTEVDLGDRTGRERNAALMPGAHVIKAFNTLYARIVAAQAFMVCTEAGMDRPSYSLLSPLAEDSFAAYPPPSSRARSSCSL